MQETKEIIAQVKKIEIKTKKIVDSLIAGNYRSIFIGNGIEFSEIREYVPGDDIRAIDWKVTARFNSPFVKEYIEERDLRVYFVFDVSSSESFGYNTSKKRKAVELAATLMFSAMKNGDNVGLFLFSENVEKAIPARKGKRHVLKLIKELVSFEPRDKKTNLYNALSFAAKVVKRRSIVFIISDFICPDFFSPLQILKKHHDVIAIRIFDKREREIPDVGLIELEDEETGEQILVDTSNEEFRRNYFNLTSQHEKYIQNNFKKNKVDLIEIKTDEPYEKTLMKFFSYREKRRR